MNIVGEIPYTRVMAWRNSDHATALVFYGGTLDEFRRELSHYPQTAVAALTNKPVQFVHVDWGNPNGAPKAYRDVYRRFKFYVFDSPNDIRWWTSRLHAERFYRWRDRAANDLLFMLERGRSGLDFVGYFYGRIQRQMRSDQNALELIWTNENGGRVRPVATAQQPSNV